MLKCTTEMNGTIVYNENTCKNITEDHLGDNFICSKCGIHLYGWYKIESDDWHDYEFKYCPNCGAKVVE